MQNFYLTLESPLGCHCFRERCELLPEHGTPAAYAQRLATQLEESLAQRGHKIKPGAVKWACHRTLHAPRPFASKGI